ncbi:MAG: L-threonylcarbamoyladenylate synthase [Thermoanaerobaculia bacterium]
MSGVPFWRLGEPPGPLADCLDRGGVLAVPTESSYALGADPFNREGVANVYRVKGRPGEKPLPVVAANRRQLAALGCDLSHPALAALAAVWPAPLSLLVPTSKPVAATAGEPRLAVRIPDHEGLRALLETLGRPLTATSANRAGRPALCTPQAAAALLAGYDAIVVDAGALPGGPPSTMIAVEQGGVRVLRPGRFPAAEIERLLATVG